MLRATIQRKLYAEINLYFTSSTAANIFSGIIKAYYQTIVLMNSVVAMCPVPIIFSGFHSNRSKLFLWLVVVLI